MTQEKEVYLDNIIFKCNIDLQFPKKKLLKKFSPHYNNLRISFLERRDFAIGRLLQNTARDNATHSNVINVVSRRFSIGCIL